MVKPGRRAAAVTYPGAKGVGHCWAYLPDAGETTAELLDRRNDLGDFARYHFASVWDSDGTEMTAAITKALGCSNIKVKLLPWVLLGIAGLFQETLRKSWKMRYLWKWPVRLDNRELVAFLGKEPHPASKRSGRRCGQ